VISREERVGRNEALFREVNERIRDVNEGLSDPSDYLCECGHAECEEHVMLTLAEYEEVRRDATRFAILPGHAVPDVERVVANCERFAVVEKTDPEAARVAVDEDPRS
jgi:hypothetical protein